MAISAKRQLPPTKGRNLCESNPCQFVNNSAFSGEVSVIGGYKVQPQVVGVIPVIYPNYS